MRAGRTGVGRYAEQLVAHLSAQDLRVTPLVNRVRLGGASIPLRPTLLWLQAVAPLAIRASGASVAHFTTGRAPLRCPVPYVLTVHDLTVLDRPEWYARRERILAAPWLRASIRRAAAIVAVSGNTARAIERRFPSAASRVRVIHEAAAEAFVARRSMDDVMRTRIVYGLPERYWLHVGALAPRKNTLRVIDAYARASAQARHGGDRAAPQLVLMGAPSAMPAAVADHCRALDVLGDITWLPALPDAPFSDVVRGAELLIAPSLHEGFGLPMIEAMACGTPVVTSRRGGLGEVVGNAAWIVEPDDIDAIAAALTRLATDPALRADLAARGRQQAARYDWRATAAATAAVYAEVARLRS